MVPDSEQVAHPKDERGTRREMYVKLEIRESCDKDNATLIGEACRGMEDDPEVQVVSVEVRPVFVVPDFAPDPADAPEQPMHVWMPQMMVDLMKVAQALNAKSVEPVGPLEERRPEE